MEDQKQTEVETKEAPKSETVSREAYEKLLREKRNYAEKAQQLEAKIKEVSEKELIEKENYKKLYEGTKQELDQERNQLKAMQDRIASQSKIGELRKELQKLGINAAATEDAIRVIDLNRVMVDQETGVITGADLAAKELKQRSPYFFTVQTPGVNTAAPDASGGPLTVEAFKKLPASEQAKRMPEMMAALGYATKK